MRITLMGCAMDNLTMEETLDRIEEFVRAAGHISTSWSTSTRW